MVIQMTELYIFKEHLRVSNLLLLICIVDLVYIHSFPKQFYNFFHRGEKNVVDACDTTLNLCFVGLT